METTPSGSHTGSNETCFKEQSSDVHTTRPGPEETGVKADIKSGTFPHIPHNDISMSIQGQRAHLLIQADGNGQLKPPPMRW